MGIITRLLVCLVLCSLLGCSNETAITKVTEAQTKIALDNSIPVVEPKDESPVKVIGEFTNVKSNGEHQQGYSVKLWKQDNKIYGLISGSGYLIRLWTKTFLASQS